MEVDTMRRTKNQGPHTKASIIKLLMTNDQAVMKAILVIYEYQTTHEKAVSHTVNNNGVGFNAPDSTELSKLARKIKGRGGLYKEELNSARAKMIKYASQLAKIANDNEIKKNLGKAM
jgi:hypothetical protein